MYLDFNISYRNSRKSRLRLKGGDSQGRCLKKKGSINQLNLPDMKPIEKREILSEEQIKLFM